MAKRKHGKIISDTVNKWLMAIMAMKAKNGMKA
jgi:hypothetical protein